MQVEPDLFELHSRDVEEIRAEFLEWKQNSKDHNPMKLAEDCNYSNTIRKNGYKKQGPKLQISKLNRVLLIDKVRGVAFVEPRVTMEELVRITLLLGFIPAVVPEYKGITVGGAINGSAIESSSHIYGQFNDACLSYDILLGDGSIIHTSPTEYPDLFYGISGSYGTLGIILLVEIKLIRSGSWVELNYQSFSKVDLALSYISKASSDRKFDYVEGIVYGSSETLVIEGKFLLGEQQPNPEKCISLEHSWSPLFYQHVKELHPTIKKEGIYVEYISIFDYLFRHDRGAFWMGGFAQHPWLLTLFLLEQVKVFSNWLPKFLYVNSYNEPKYPGSIFRAFFGWMMTSERLYRMLHSGKEEWFSDHFVIQDFYLPERHTAPFIEHVLKEYAITPLWICPLLSTNHPQFLSPHYLNGDSKLSTHLIFDVGVYGFPKSRLPAKEITKKLEKLTQAFWGRKMLYGHSFYSPEEFWQIYSKENYIHLREKYHARGTWFELIDKVLAK
jgi:hypothetical protein